MNKRTKSNSIRLIAGQWRGRRLRVVDSEGLRPTTDRVRETLFNWLQHNVAGAHCLDLFAGTGALGLECLSRGAEWVQFVESKRAVADHLQANLRMLGAADKAQVSVMSALQFISQKPQTQFDLVFLDPPFQSNLLAPIIELLDAGEWFTSGALIYIEQASSESPVTVPDHWQTHRHGQAGQSRYCLYAV